MSKNILKSLALTLFIIFSSHCMEQQEKEVVLKKIWSLLGIKNAPSLLFITALFNAQKTFKEIDLLNIPDELKDCIIKIKNDLGQKIIEIICKPQPYEHHQGLYLYTIWLLIDAGANLNFQNESGRIALKSASMCGYIEIVRLLINNGADLNIQGMDDCTALMITAWPVRNHIEIARLLIDNGADLNMQNKFGETALMMAIYNGRLEMTKLLMDKGADVDLRNIYGKDALMMAIEYGNQEILDLFKKEIVQLFIAHSEFIQND